MADEGSPTPRRALGPLPDDGDDAPSGGRFARAFSPDEPSPLTSTARLRRLALTPSSPDSPDDPLDVPATTPVPPPAPVLPQPESALPASAGRRFSASAEPSEFTYVPRRSAVSATSPLSPIDGFPPQPRPTAPPPVTIPAPASAASASRSALTAPVPEAPAKTPTPPRPGGAEEGPRSVATAPLPSDWATPASSTASLAAPAAAPEPTPEPDDAPAAAAPRKKGLFGRRPRPAATGEDTARLAPATAAVAAAPAAPAEPTPGKRPATGTPDAPERPTRPGRAAAPRDRSSRPALIIIASVAVVALLVAAAVWLLTLRSGASSGTTANPSTASALDPLLTTADLGTLAGQTWTESTGTTDSVRPTCLPTNAAGLPNALRTASRKTTSATNPAASVVQVVDTYADVAAATTAYDLRLTQAGTCKDGTAWISGANDVSGLADSAMAVRLVAHETPDQFHTLLLSRTGRSVSLVDITTTDAAVPADDLARATATALSRQCGNELGTCPSSITTANVPPPAGEPKGWLVEADLPRITAGAGRWGATDPSTTLVIPGSQCEAMNLEAVTGTVAQGQRTLLLADDTAAPNGFGVDMVTYAFSSPDAATKLAAKLTKNINGCADRAPTATVKDGPSVKGNADADSTVAGSTFLISQKTETTTVLYRVAVLTVDDEVVYLLGNPSSSFDFTDSQWKAIALRAGQRAAQG